MREKPEKALLYSQLAVVSSSSGTAGSHQVKRVSFVEQGALKKGYYKAISPQHHYPELLALMSVSASVFKRSFQGSNAAEERLVFDDQGRLIGTLSIEIEGFTPLHCLNEPLEPGQQKERVIPSTKTLIEKKFIEVLFARFYLDDDDSHPKNVGLAGDCSADIDYDMHFYSYTIIIKSARPIIGTPKKSVNYTNTDWEHFPQVQDAKHYHWPTYENPGEVTLPAVVPGQSMLLQQILPKPYADPSQFRNLSSSAEAQDQKFAFALRILTTYQPEVLRARLVALMGDRPLNYKALPEELSDKYETEFPEFFNETTNTQPFVDFIMRLYQKHYDSLYRLVIFYMGCEDNGYGVRLLATHLNLYFKPSVYKNIREWSSRQNERFYVGADTSLQFNLEEMQKRYHQIWRDAFTPNLVALLSDGFTLINRLIDKTTARREPSPINIEPPAGKITTDESLTEAWQLFGVLQPFPQDKISTITEDAVGKDSSKRQGLLLLIEFINKYYEVARAYYTIPRQDLRLEDNTAFVNAMEGLIRQYTLPIRTHLDQDTSEAVQFSAITRRLNEFNNQARLEMHLLTNDEEMGDVLRNTRIEELPLHTNEPVINKFTENLFRWAKQADPKKLRALLHTIINEHYSNLMRSERSTSLTSYLDRSENQEGDNRLAYILCSSSTQTGKLNTQIIRYLAPEVIQCFHLPSVKRAIDEKTFTQQDYELFARKAAEAASIKFTHLNNQRGIEAFYKNFYARIDAIEKSIFLGIINAALRKYEKESWGFNSRRQEVADYIKDPSQAKAVAMIFSKGGVLPTSLNTILFEKFVQHIQSEVHSSKASCSLGDQLITGYSEDDKKKVFEELVVHFARQAAAEYSCKRGSTLATSDAGQGRSKNEACSLW